MRLGFLLAFLLVLSQQRVEKTTLDGVYTSAQATRGQDLYGTYCSSCHREDLSGGGSFGMEEAPALQRDRFMEGRDLYSVFASMKANMPADNPSTLADQAYLDILTYVLQQNGYPAGTDELVVNADTLKSIRIVSDAN